MLVVLKSPSHTLVSTGQIGSHVCATDTVLYTYSIKLTDLHPEDIGAVIILIFQKKEKFRFNGF